MKKLLFYSVYFLPTVVGFTLSAAIRFWESGYENLVGLALWIIGMGLNILWVKRLTKAGVFGHLVLKLQLDPAHFRDYGA
jgi:hypothetical protein